MPEQDEQAVWHRRFAAGLFNRTWELLDAPARTAAEDDELLAAAFASRYHWGPIGDAGNWAIGDGQIARAAAAIGLDEVAIRYATKALATAESEGWQDFRLASAHEVMARAYAAAGDGAARDRHLASARQALELLDDPEDRAVIGAQIDGVPPARTS